MDVTDCLHGGQKPAPSFSRMTFPEQLTFPDWFPSEKKKIIESNALGHCNHLVCLLYGFVVQPLGPSESGVKTCL